MNQKRLKEVLNYDPKTGIFRWKIHRMYNARAGDIAGSMHNGGYRSIGIDNKMYLVHRLAWLYVHGHFPKEIDHINHDKRDNRIDNLRNVTHLENGRNMSITKNNTSGIPGVYWCKKSKKWKAHIQFDGEYKYLGLFDDINLAKQVREKAKKKYNYHPNHA